MTDDMDRGVWSCRIGGPLLPLQGGDTVMRQAVEKAYLDVTLREAEFCFSGWGDGLDEAELAVVEDRLPDPVKIRESLMSRLAVLPGDPDLHARFPDVAPGLLDVLKHLGDKYGPSGVLRVAMALWPDARYGEFLDTKEGDE